MNINETCKKINTDSGYKKKVEALIEVVCM
jgi:hypothetical protein